jgi:hypothetical protein
MGLKRELPNTDERRALALKKAMQKIAISAPGDIVLTAQTQARLAITGPDFVSKLALRGQALGQQMLKTPVKNTEKKAAALHISHFIQCHDNAALRGETGFSQSDRTYFGLTGSNDKLPPLEADADVYTWGENLIDGEANRIADGRPAVPYPTIAAVATKYNAFKATFGQHNLLKKAFDDAQEAVEDMREDVDSLILRIWNEVEAGYSEESKPSMRRNAREWGVVYILTKGSEPSPDDFSIMGTVTDSASGNTIEGVVVMQETPEIIVLTDEDGKFFIDRGNAGSFTLNVHKSGYIDQQVSVTVVDGVITVKNFQLVATATGTVQGVVTQGGVGVAASVTFSTTPVGVNTEQCPQAQ